MTVHVAIIEDDARARALIADVIDRDPELELVATYDRAETALKDFARAAEIVVIDLQLPGIDGVEMCRRLGTAPSAPERLILTALASDDMVYAAVRAGASGYLLKRDIPTRLPSAIREVMAGGSVIEPRLARRFWNLFQSSIGRAAEDPYGLSPAEVEVLALLARGLTNREAGGVLEVRPRQVKLHIERIFDKLGVRTRVDAVTLALRAGLIRL